MARIQHIAISCKDNVATAEFYKRVFGMVETERRPHKEIPGVVHISVTDGNISLALVPEEMGEPEGLNHIGFQVEDVATTAATAINLGAKPGDDLQRGNNPENVIVDPTGTRLDLTERGWLLDPKADA